MSGLEPVVRHMILCEDVLVDPMNPKRLTIVGLINTIRSVESPPFPLLYPELCVFVQLTECRGKGSIRMEILEADTGERVARTSSRSLSFVNNPLGLFTVVFRLRDCTFPAPGLHLVQIRYNDSVIAEYPLMLREIEP